MTLVTLPSPRQKPVFARIVQVVCRTSTGSGTIVGIVAYSFVASINVKSPRVSSKSITKPCCLIASRSSDNLCPSANSLVVCATNIEPLTHKHRFASAIYSRQFLPISDKQNTTTSRLPSSTYSETDFISHGMTLLSATTI